MESNVIIKKCYKINELDLLWEKEEEQNIKAETSFESKNCNHFGAQLNLKIFITLKISIFLSLALERPRFQTT